MKNTVSTIAAAVAIFFALTSFNAKAQTNNGQDQSIQNFTATIAIPIAINPGTGSLDLGVIAPGTTKTINVAGSPTIFADFNIHGEQNWPIQVSGSVTTTSFGVTLNDIKWESKDASNAWIAMPDGATLSPTNTNLDATGDAYVRTYPLSMTADVTASSDNIPSFDVVVTAAYRNW